MKYFEKKQRISLLDEMSSLQLQTGKHFEILLGFLFSLGFMQVLRY